MVTTAAVVAGTESARPVERIAPRSIVQLVHLQTVHSWCPHCTTVLALHLTEDVAACLGPVPDP